MAKKTKPERRQDPITPFSTVAKPLNDYIAELQTIRTWLVTTAPTTKVNLTRRDRITLVEALLAAAPAPNKRLKHAVERQAKLVKR